jgi:transcriptional regulator with XRE-family HTH domain
MEITPAQIRAARALLRIEQSELAERAGVSVVTVRRLEAEDGLERVAPATVGSVRSVLEQAGVEFIANGVQQRPKARSDAAARYEALRAISLRSGEKLKGRELLTEADLYDENGLPA